MFCSEKVEAECFDLIRETSPHIPNFSFETNFCQRQHVPTKHLASDKLAFSNGEGLSQERSAALLAGRTGWRSDRGRARPAHGGLLCTEPGSTRPALRDLQSPATARQKARPAPLLPAELRPHSSLGDSYLPNYPLLQQMFGMLILSKF